MQKFDVANLNEEEKEIRNNAIEFVFSHLSAKHSHFTKSDAEELYDKMQQAAIDAGHSAWEFYRKAIK
jgi:hypothetical protein